MKRQKSDKKKKTAITINTRWQDATECVTCGSDTSETMGYCRDCDKGQVKGV